MVSPDVVMENGDDNGFFSKESDVEEEDDPEYPNVQLKIEDKK